MIWLAASLLALGVGPLLFTTLGHRRGVVPFLDGFVVLAVPGLIFLHFIPEAIEHRSILPVLALIVGFWAPMAAERFLRDPRGRTDQLALLLGVTGMAVHGMLDGAALPSVAMGGGDAPLGLAVILHRIPVGLAIWWMARSIFSRGTAVGALAALGAVTVLGYLGGAELSALVGSEAVEIYQAFVGGSLVHVIFHRSAELAPPTAPRTPSRYAEGGGALLGLMILATVAVTEAGGGHHGAIEFLERLWVLSATSAPALLIAYIFAGLLFAYLPAGSIRWMSRGGSLSAAARGMAVGLPLPVCSCGVVPLYQTLVKRGAAPAAAMAFLVATPELGLDAIFLSVPLLGGQMTVLRVGAAAIAALAVGWWVGGRLKRISETDQAEATTARDAHAEVGCGEGCGCTAKTRVATRDENDPLGGPEEGRFGAALRTGLVQVVDETAPWIIVGLGIAALAAPLLAGGWLAELPPVVDVLLFAIIGFPTYVCAASATPMVAALLASGLSPGAGIAFLITGPATNATTLGVISGLHGRRAALQFAGTLVALSVGLGLLVNFTIGSVPVPSLEQLTEEAPGVLHQISLALLVLLFLASVLRRGIRRFAGEVSRGLGHSHSHSHEHGHHGHDQGHSHDDDGHAPTDDAHRH